MRVETSALVTLKKRLRNIRMLMRMAEGEMPCWTMVWGRMGGTTVPLLADRATTWLRSEMAIWELSAGRRILYVSMRNEATIDENRPVWCGIVRKGESKID